MTRDHFRPGLLWCKLNYEYCMKSSLIILLVDRVRYNVERGNDKDETLDFDQTFYET